MVIRQECSRLYLLADTRVVSKRIQYACMYVFVHTCTRVYVS